LLLSAERGALRVGELRTFTLFLGLRLALRIASVGWRWPLLGRTT